MLHSMTNIQFAHKNSLTSMTKSMQKTSQKHFEQIMQIGNTVLSIKPNRDIKETKEEGEDLIKSMQSTNYNEAQENVQMIEQLSMKDLNLDLREETPLGKINIMSNRSVIRPDPPKSKSALNNSVKENNIYFAGKKALQSVLMIPPDFRVSMSIRRKHASVEKKP
jgi:hypothetical protein